MYYIISSVENLNKIFLEFCDDLENVVPSKKELIDNARKKIIDAFEKGQNIHLEIKKPSNND